MVNLHEDEFRTYEGAAGPAVSRTGGAIFAGPRSRHLVIDTEEQRSLVEVTFELGGAAYFFGVPMSAVRDRLVELEALWGRDGRLLRERLLAAATPERRLLLVEAVLRDHLAEGSRLDPVVAVAASRIERGLSVAAVAAELEISPRRFTGRFRERVGLGPKRYSRVRRLQRLVGSIDPAVPTRWVDAAAAHGFADQAHLINEFREMTGVTPTAYRARSATEPNHLPVPPG
jgi:AraC-like DNA-binding protein